MDAAPPPTPEDGQSGRAPVPVPGRDPISRLSHFLGEFLAPLFLVAVAISVYEVVARYLFNAPTVWVHETTILLSAICFVVSGLYSLERREHIRITVLVDRFPPRLRRAIDWLGTALALTFLLAVAWGGWKLGWSALVGWETTQSALNSPTPAILKPLIVLCAGLMALQLLVHRRQGLHW